MRTEQSNPLSFEHHPQGWARLHEDVTLSSQDPSSIVSSPVAIPLAKNAMDHRACPLGLHANSAAMQKLIDLACRVAQVDSTVLITGESGTGKERIARLIHEMSPRANGSFIAVNCGAIAETLLESELFGHARGAFTGASTERSGLFEAANGGTLLLDEVGEVSPGMQVKLLRALQEREVRRVGENKSRCIDVRVVAATNRDLAQCVADGLFRQDLYYRLKVVELQVPPLRQRNEDILPLAKNLLQELALRMKRGVCDIAPEVADQLMRYEWPGNVRELENAMERAIALAGGKRIELDDLPEEIRQAFRKPVVAIGAVKSLEAVARDYILAVLELNHGNQTRTAEQLEIGSATLYRKLRSYGLTSKQNAKRKHAAPTEPSPRPSRSLAPNLTRQKVEHQAAASPGSDDDLPQESFADNLR